ncbi:MAG: hypothetical protein Q8O83_04225 [bacterium]|nr:hypothetical protein [bacterium]
MKKTKSIFLTMDNLRYYSDILRGETIQELAKLYSVVVLSPDVDEATAKKRNYFIHPNVIYAPYIAKNKNTIDLFNTLRYALIRTYDSFAATKDWYYNRQTLPFVKRTLTRIGTIFPSWFPTPGFFTALEIFFITPTEQFQSLVKKYSPSLMVTMTPGFVPFEAELVLSAKKMSLPTAAIYMSFDNPFNQGKFLRKTNYITAWSADMKQDTEKFLGYPDHAIFVTGCVRFDHYIQNERENALRSRNDFLLSKNLDPNKKTIMHATSTPRAFPWRKEFIDEFMRLKKNGELIGDPNILIRIHPVDILEPYKEYLGMPGVCIEKAGKEIISDSKAPTKKIKTEMDGEDRKNLTETMKYSDVVVNCFSTTTLEASIFNTPIVSIVFPKGAEVALEYETPKEFIKSGGITVASNAEELKHAINAYIKNPSLHQKGREILVDRFLQFTDGMSWRRTADAIKKIVEKPSGN